MTAEELQSEWRLWDVVNNVGSPRPYTPASLSFCTFMVQVVIPKIEAGLPLVLPCKGCGRCLDCLRMERNNV